MLPVANMNTSSAGFGSITLKKVVPHDSIRATQHVHSRGQCVFALAAACVREGSNHECLVSLAEILHLSTQMFVTTVICRYRMCMFHD